MALHHMTEKESKQRPGDQVEGSRGRMAAEAEQRQLLTREPAIVPWPL